MTDEEIAEANGVVRSLCEVLDKADMPHLRRSHVLCILAGVYMERHRPRSTWGTRAALNAQIWAADNLILRGMAHEAAHREVITRG